MRPLFWIVLIFAVSLQIQITLFQSENYTGLRISLADMILPLALLYALIHIALKKSQWPRGHKSVLFLLTLMTVAMTFSLGQTYWTGSDNFKWALVNKYVGFFILLSYLVLGSWLSANTDRATLIRVFSASFCGFFLLILLLSLMDTILQIAAGVSLWIGDFPWDGFMANRNAFALPAVFSLLLMICQRNEKPAPLPRKYYAALWFLLPFCAVYNASRAGWIAGAVILGGLLFKDPALAAKKILPLFILGAVLAYGSTFLHTERNIQNNTQLNRLLAFTASTNEDAMYGGDRKRMITLQDGLELYRQSNPFLGAGIGRYRDFQTQKRGKFIDVIDCTPLWLLVETGLLGLLSFAGFFMLGLRETCRKGFSKEQKTSEDAGFYRAVFFFLLVFAAFSLFHEIMYTRFLWFVLGVVLWRPQTDKPLIQTECAAESPESEPTMGSPK